MCPSCKKQSKVSTSPEWIQPISHLAQILIPINFLWLAGLEYLIWLPAVVVSIFVIDRKLDGKFGVLTPIDNQETHSGEQGEDAKPDNAPS